jgi:hypothetical protein
VFLLFCVAMFLFKHSHGDTTAIILQNGLGGYSGCEDSYTTTEFPETNYSTSVDLQLFNCIP